MKNKVLKIGVILVVILTMTMTNFVFVGKGLISYAVDNNSTNNSNVEFSSYFKNEKGEKVSNLDIVTSNLENSLWLEIAVKQEGYFNGTIHLENSNFRLKESDSEYINKIENNTITLNQINAGTTAEIEVKVEFEKSPEFKVDLLNMESSIRLNGIYRDSSQKDKEISGTQKVTLKLVSDVKTEDITNDLQIITNKTLKINGEDKKVLQLSLKAGLKNNNYPIKNINIEVTVPEVGNIQPVVEENTKLNNMTNKNLVYDGTVARISMFNENGQWKNSGLEEIILTYIYDAKVSFDETQIVANQNIELYDGTTISAISAEVVARDSEEYDATILAEVLNSENSIYKGRIYAGIDRQYQNTTNVNVNLVGVAEEVEVQEEPSTYIVNDINVNANIYYTQTIIKKEELISIIGEQGSLTILDQDGNIINTINANTQADESGNITTIYNENTVKGITTKLNNIEKIGTIHLEHTKVIKQTDQQIAKEATAIATKLTQKYIQNGENAGEAEKEQRIELLDTKTEAKITMNKDSLSTLIVNNVEINAILKSAKEENDLYKNPKLQIILPQEIEDIQINSINKLYAEELQIEKTALTDVVNVGKVLEIELLGEQTNYLNEISEGIQIVINADMTFNKTMSTKRASITMKYTNENGNEAQYETAVDFDIISKYGVLVYSKANNYNEENTVLESTSNENLKGQLSVAEDEKVVTIERSIINNYEEPITNIGLVGTLPEKEEEVVNGETLKSTFLADLENIAITNKEAKIYYSENNEDWEETTEDIEDIRFYKIELQDDAIQPGELATIEYQLKIPENLTLDQSTYEKLSLSYQYGAQAIQEDYATYLSTNSIEVARGNAQENVNGLGKIEISATSAGQELKDGQEIYEGQTVKETVTITNNTGKDINNLKVTAKQDNAIFYVENVTQETNTLTGGEMDVTRIIEDENVKEQEFIAEILKSGESISFTYQFSVQEKAGEETTGIVMVQADGMEETTIATLTNPIKEAKLKLRVACNYNEERQIVADSVMPITLTAKNISDKALENVMIELPIPEETTFGEEYMETNEKYTYLGINNKVANFRINSMEVGEQIDIIVSLVVNDFKDREKQINLSIQSTIDNETYTSNELNRSATQQKADITVMQVGNIEKEEIETGDNLIYTATIKNTSELQQEVQLIDYVPYAAVVQKAYTIVEGQEMLIEDIQDNEIDTKVTLNENAQIQLVIETTIDEMVAETNEITNIVEVNAYNQYLESNEVTYKLANIADNVTQNEISGVVWLDQNQNGQKEVGEDIFSNVVVKVINTETSQTVKETRTDNQGKYQFTQLPNGKYIVIVEYDNKFYSLTEYKKEGVNEDQNSDAIAKEVNGQKVAVTDEIEINDNNVTNIDIGLIRNTIFDLKLDKYLNKVIIQNAEGTKMVEYDKAQLAKVEIDAKQINNATVLVEYGIDITNEGEIAGYASEIIDYMPNDFKFNSELNKSWYTTNDKDIHNITLANEIIYPGETKTVTLTLTKTMTQNNVGTSINTAEIAKASNELLIEDIDSTPGNYASDEDDLSTAELIISIRTGIGITIGIVLSVVVVALIAVMVIIMKKRRDENE